MPAISYLASSEKETVAWFEAIVAEGAARLQHSRLDPLGVLALALRADRSAADDAWLAYVAAEAEARGAAKEFIAEHGVLVLILHRYAKARQKTFRFAGEGGPQGRPGGHGREQGPQIGAGPCGGECQMGEDQTGQTK